MPVCGVEQHFSRAAVKYTEEARVQAQLRLEILARALRTRPRNWVPRRILDIGCGTGYLTAYLAARWPEATIDAVDIAREMIEVARYTHSDYRNIQWHLADFRNVDLEPGYDLIVSNATLQWLPPLNTSMSRIAWLLEANAILILGVIVEGSLKELHQARSVVAPGRPPVAALPSIDQCFIAAGEAGLLARFAEAKKTTLLFSSAREVFTHLQSSGVNGNIFADVTGSAARPEILSESRLSIREVKALEHAYNSEYREGSVPLSYHSLLLELELLGRS